MSDAGQEPRGWHFYVRGMIEFAEKVLIFTNEMDRDAFVGDALTYDATLRNLELIGEAATHIPDTVRKTHPEVPWRTIIGTRNRLAHAYLGIDNDVIWDVIQRDIPALLPALRRIPESVD